MSRQTEILISIAKKYNLNIQDVEYVWQYFCDKIHHEISKNKKIDNLYSPENFPVIHIDNFGKFVPIEKNIKYANKHLKNKL